MKLSHVGSLEALLIGLGLLAFGKAENCDLGVWQHQFNGSCYYFLETENTWYQAKQICEDIGGSLASVHSDEENEFIKEKAGKSNIWLGLVGVSLHPIIFGWEDGTVLEFEKWEVSEPDGESLDLMCARMGANGRWKDTSCENKQWAVCKRSRAVTTAPESPTTSEPPSSPKSTTLNPTTGKSTVFEPTSPAATTPNAESEDGCHSFTWDDCINDFGDPIVSVKEQSPSDCQRLCVGIFEGCKTFVFNFHKRECSLYSKVVGNVSDECKTYGGPKEPTINYCQQSRCTEFWYSGCEYEGFHLDDFPQVTSTGVCQTVCKDYVEGCNYWVYDFEARKCHTYSNPIMECELMIGPYDYEVGQCLMVSS